jgi:hypothetical protein
MVPHGESYSNSKSGRGISLKYHERILKGEKQAEDEQILHLQSEGTIIVDWTILKIPRTSIQKAFKFCILRNITQIFRAVPQTLGDNAGRKRSSGLNR